MLDGIGGLGDVVSQGDKVGIKINLVEGLRFSAPDGGPPTESHQTHPEVVRALVELLRDAGARDIYILEALADHQSYRELGYEALADALNITLIDLNNPDPYQGFASVSPGEDAFIYDELLVNPMLEEFDVMVSASKMKCHYNAGVTCSMKNLVGLVPVQYYETRRGDGWRSAMHGPWDETPTRLPRVILDLNHARPIDLAILDGIKTAEGGETPQWDSFGAVDLGIMIAGKNALATDAVATAVMGFDPTAASLTAPFIRADNYLNMAAELGLGTNHLEDIDVVGLAVADVTRQFKIADGAYIG